MAKYPEIEEKMNKRVEGFNGELKTIRAGRANASVLDKVAIDYYGSMTPIAQVGSISSPEPRMLVIQPWDASVLKEIENDNIILMHDIHSFTVASVERLLPELAARGYQFVTVSELFYYNNVDIMNGKVYYGGYN